MKICKNCGAEMQDNAMFCTRCGTKAEEQNVEEQKVEEQKMDPEVTQTTVGEQQTETTQENTDGQNVNYGQNPGYGQNVNYGQGQSYGQAPNYGQNQGGYQQYYAPVDPYDHTAEFDAKDISENKVIAMLLYLMGTVGIIIALLASKDSPYLAFHIRQALKFTVLEVLTAIIAGVLFITIVVPIAAGIFFCVLFVCKIIAFFSICKGNAKEPYIVRSFNFLK